MTTPADPHEHPPGDAAPLSAAHEAAVRRVLAEVGAESEAIPADVAARLDGVLDEIVADRADRPAGPAPTAVVALSVRRRNRVRLLVGAAAAAVVAGLGIQFATANNNNDDMLTARTEQEPHRGAETGAGSTASGARAPEALDGAADSKRSVPESSLAPDLTSLGEVQRNATDEPVRTVRSRHVRDDLAKLQAVALPRTAADYSGVTFTAPEGFVCALGDVGSGILIGIRFEGASALAAFREPTGSTQVAEVLQCGTGESLRSVTIPAIH